MANSAVTPKKNCWVHGLHKIFATPEDLLECIVVDEYKDQVNEFTVIYVVCDKEDAAIFGPIYKENTKWIIANKTIFGGNAEGGVKEYPEILNVKTNIEVPITPTTLWLEDPNNFNSAKPKNFYYDGTIKVGETTYHQWLLGYANSNNSTMYEKGDADGYYQHILTIHKNFENASWKYPYDIDGYMIGGNFYSDISEYQGSTDITINDKIVWQPNNTHPTDFYNDYYMDRTGSVWIRLEEGFEVPEENRYFIALGRIKGGKMTIMNDSLSGEIRPIPVEKIIAEQDQNNNIFFVASAHDIVLTLMGDSYENDYEKRVHVKNNLWYGTDKDSPDKYGRENENHLQSKIGAVYIDRNKVHLTGITRRENATTFVLDGNTGKTIEVPDNSVEYGGNRFNKRIYLLLLKGYIPKPNTSFSFEIEGIIHAIPLNLNFHLYTRDAMRYDASEEKKWKETYEPQASTPKKEPIVSTPKKVSTEGGVGKKVVKKTKSPSYYDKTYVKYDITYHKQIYPTNLYTYSYGERLSY